MVLGMRKTDKDNHRLNGVNGDFSFLRESQKFDPTESKPLNRLR